jgi:hypothetical protein
MLVILPVTVFAITDCRKSELEGKADAGKFHSSIGWVAAGVGSGLMLGLVGTGVITWVAASVDPHPMGLPSNPDYNISCYDRGYQKRARRKNIVSALGGSLVGTATVVYIILEVSGLLEE